MKYSLLNHAIVYTIVQQLRMHRPDKTKSIKHRRGVHKVQLEAEELWAADVPWESVLFRDVDMIYK